MNATYKIFLRTDTVRKDKSHSIYLRVTINRKKKEFSLNVSTKQEFWDPQKCRLKKTVPGSYPANIKIDAARTKTESIFYNYNKDRKSFTLADFERDFQNNIYGSDSFFAFVENEIDRLLKLGIISPADPGKCPFASPIVVVSKKDATWRMCVDFRQLNDQTIKDAYPLPRIDEIFNSLHGANCFVALDLLMGYHQIAVAEADKPKTAFITHRGLFVYNKMPFGLCNAPATFQRLMDSIYREHLGRDTTAYLDDVLTFATNFTLILPAFERNLKILINTGLKCKARKCQIFPKTIIYLGHVLSHGSIAPDQSKLDKVRKWPFPTTGLEVLSFLGLCNYYRKFIPRFAEIADPLYKVSNENSVLSNNLLLESFNELKDALCGANILRLPNPHQPFIMETDASLIAVGAVLKQEIDGEELPVNFYSQALSSSQRNYSTYERELFAVVKACEAFRVFLLGREFTLRTDHRALCGLFSSSLQTSNRVVKWVMRLQPFKFTIQILKGKDNVVADALSRIPWVVQTPDSNSNLEKSEDSEDISWNLMLMTDSEDQTVEPNMPDNPLSLERIISEQMQDSSINKLIQWIARHDVPTKDDLAHETPFVKSLAQQIEQLILEQGALVSRENLEPPIFRIIIPPSLIEEVIYDAHEGVGASHEGVEKTLRRILNFAYWPGMRRDIKLFIAACPACDKFRNVSHGVRAPLGSIPASNRFDLVAMDVVGG